MDMKTLNKMYGDYHKENPMQTFGTYIKQNSNLNISNDIQQMKINYAYRAIVDIITEK